MFYLLLLSLVGLFLQNVQAQGISANRSKPADDNRFSQDGFLKIDGIARLIIGLYELPTDDEKLREIARSGFNLVRVLQDINALHRVHQHELYAWICLGSTVKLKESDPNNEQRLAQIINKLKDHPSLLVWELPDEALWNIWWSRHPWIFGGQQQELRKCIEKTKNQTTNTNTTKWLSLLRKANINPNPKHEPSVYMTIPVHLSSEKTPQIGHRSDLISHRSFPIDQPIPPRARSNRTNPSTAHR